MELRDELTEGHTRRVTELTLQLARRLGVPENELIHIRRGALLHDIGKMGIPDAILHKPGPLTGSEKDLMHRHPQFAYDMLSPIDYLRPALDIPFCHHELWNGSGYPRGLKGEEIPLAARIFTIVDNWDALTSDRPYRPAWTLEQARLYLLEHAGELFDPHIVNVFLDMIATQPDSPTQPG
ncbi:MAG: HD-GYP domain-containing protein [Anaerolineales bacterium]